MRKRVLSMLLCAAIAIGLMSAAWAADSETEIVTVSVEYGQTEARSMLDGINEFRTGDEAWYWNSDDTTKTTCSGLSELEYDYDLEKVAMQRAVEIALTFEHTRPDGSSCFTAYSESGVSYSNAGENIAAGYTSAAAVLEGWKETDESYSGQGHRRNMLNSSYTAVGIAHVVYKGTDYWVQEFLAPSTGASATEANDSATDVDVEIATSRLTSTALEVSSDEMDVTVGDTVALPAVSAKILFENSWPESARTVGVDAAWSVEDTSVATISDGKLTGVKAGTTTAVATALGKTAEVSVTVAEACVHDYQSEFEWTAVEDAEDGEVPYTARATVTCSNCDFEETVDAVVESSTDDDGNTVYTATATLSNGDTVKDTKTVTKYELGDIDGDESINMSDVTLLQQYATDLNSLTDEQLSRADLNSDGGVNMTDVTILQQYVTDIITELPAAS